MFDYVILIPFIFALFVVVLGLNAAALIAAACVMYYEPIIGGLLIIALVASIKYEKKDNVDK